MKWRKDDGWMDYYLNRGTTTRYFLGLAVIDRFLGRISGIFVSMGKYKIIQIRNEKGWIVIDSYTHV